MKTMKSIIILGPAWPFRGGLAGFNHTLARTFMAMGRLCRIFTFTTQYPSFLFPGKSQFDDSEAPEGIDISRELSSVNPFSWIRTGFRVRRLRPDALIVRYWIPLMAPALGTVCRIARWGGKTRTIALLDNVVPHEKRFMDSALTRYFVGSVDGFVYMSEQVYSDLRHFTRTKPAIFSPHPMFTHYGDKMSREEACAGLGLDPAFRYIMFFGFIRDYKGLDILLDAWAILRRTGKLSGCKLIVAGEYYSGREQYEHQIERLGLAGELVMMTHFITDQEVSPLFSAADIVVQPYKNATQSGVTQVAYYYGVPMIVTDVGGLREIVPDGEVGYVVQPDPESIAAAMERFYAESRAEEFAAGIARYKERFTWESMASNFDRLYSMINSDEKIDKFD